jgi:hypothetical protein
MNQCIVTKLYCNVYIIAKQRRIRSHNSRTNVYSSLLDKSAPMDWRDSYHVACFLCGLRCATIELCFLCVVRAERI